MIRNALSPTSSLARVPVTWLVLACFVLIRGLHPASSGSIDPDVYWHLLYGHWIIEHGRLPAVDMWSWTLNGQAYVLTQWMGEVSMALAEIAGGELGKQLLAASLVGATVWISYSTVRRHVGSSLMALSVAFLGAITLVSMPRRPHLFTFVGLALTAHCLDGFSCTRRISSLAPLPILFALWVNLHGGFALGIAYGWGFIGVRFIAAYMQRSLLPERSSLIVLSVVMTGATLATLISPYGVGAWEAAAHVASLKSVAAGITEEWQATSIRTPTGLAFLMLGSAIFASFSHSTKRVAVADTLMAIALLLAGMASARLAIMTSVLLVPILGRYISHTPLYALLHGEEGRRYESMRWLSALGALMFVGTCAAFLGSHDRAYGLKVAANYPFGEVAYIRDHGLHGHILNPMEPGGFLLKALGQPVFLDTRLDLYGDDYYFAFVNANEGRPGWKAFIAKWNPDIVLLESTAPLTQLLQDDGSYTKAFAGPRYTLLTRTRTDVDRVEEP